MGLNKNQQVFLEVVKAGLWDRNNLDYNLDLNGVDWGKVYQLAQEQSIQGLVLQGIEWVKNHNLNDKVNLNLDIPQILLLQWIGEVQMIEQQNKTMNQFVAELVEKTRAADIYAILVKGQGVAQCYEKPLWRPSGDVDLLLSEVNYKKAKELLLPLSSSNKNEERYSQHLGMSIGQWYVEIHGSLRTGLSARVDKEVDAVQESVFIGGNVRSWDNNGTLVFLPASTEDVFLVFTHFIKHFYKEGVGLRQICDWCRLMWMYRDSLNYGMLEQRIKRTGLVSEWKAFYNLASRYLGMPDLGSGLMVHDSRFDKKADRIMEFILKSGNMGHNRDMSHFSKYPYLIRKCVSMGRRIGDLINHARIFQKNIVWSAK